jgi:hypothetical protein
MILPARCAPAAKWPGGRAAKQHDELAALHSIASSVSASSLSGMVRPSVFAVFRLITSSSLAGCSTGKSVGLAPLRILSMWLAACQTAPIERKVSGINAVASMTSLIFWWASQFGSRCCACGIQKSMIFSLSVS